MVKKPTMMEAKKMIDDLTKHVNWMSRMLESLGIAFSNYVQFNGNEEDFKNYLENNKNIHKLTQEELNARNTGDNSKDNAVSTEKIREKGNG